MRNQSYCARILEKNEKACICVYKHVGFAKKVTSKLFGDVCVLTYVSARNFVTPFAE